ncbi:MAG: hypothetical protein WCA46_20645 [Actinocatenispora sp.]
MSAKQTNMPDPDGATKALASLSVQADTLEGKVAGIIKDITGMEGGKPWGTAEYGRKFEEQYQSSGGGAQHVKENAHKMTDFTKDGARTAFNVVTGTVDLDDNLTGLFKAGPEV